MRITTLIQLLFISLLSSHTLAKEKLTVIYPNVNHSGEESFGFAALKLALENSGREYELKTTPDSANSTRIRKLIKTGKISISDFGTSSEFENDFLAIYFPIDLGLNGWRIFIIHEKNRDKFTEITSLEKLQSYSAGQGMGWSDVKILENAGIKVHQPPKIDNIFQMAERRRFDFFPLGANEAHSFLAKYQGANPSLVIDKTTILRYPFGRFFFVKKDNIELRDAVYQGLVKSFENGSFLKLFKSHDSNKALFTKANLKNRKQIAIENPYMTEEFKRIPRKYFFELEMLN